MSAEGEKGMRVGGCLGAARAADLSYCRAAPTRMPAAIQVTNMGH